MISKFLHCHSVKNLIDILNGSPHPIAKARAFELYLHARNDLRHWAGEAVGRVPQSLAQAIEIERCLRCGAHFRVIAGIEQRAVIEPILEHLARNPNRACGLPTYRWDDKILR